jgi:hypothetical protein
LVQEKQQIVEHLKRLLCGLNFDYVDKIETLQSAEGIIIEVKFSDVLALGDSLGGSTCWLLEAK